MSGIRHTNFMVPDPVSYARAAVATIGIKEFTYGCVSHTVQVHQLYCYVYSVTLSFIHSHSLSLSPPCPQGYIIALFPSHVFDHFAWNMMKDAKARYLKMKAKAK